MRLSLVRPPEGLVSVVRGETVLPGVPEGPPQSRRALGKDWETLWGRVLAQTCCVTLGRLMGTCGAQFPHLKMRGLEVITLEHAQQRHWALPRAAESWAWGLCV